ncbi:hypothetical protein HanXRQr2_Chr04g0174431 [Helianthus annuus]|uniref:Uncharacterized protein n=1 Tax=Helianthus annuus TaxID=4232 RepID=A0A9K3NS51_HELAN|nr:hypothetical protein HanXRQr2_Chr04g0174431 [Helianthus annuus]KAJ0581597.1 hypothetical protein HanHA300_Chr04g0142851 [Helianthus annuus]KAJ0597562.1 hypothetical protein HanHA89_Chr04g0156021 [Helianthus annuus]KAJ0758207.1 hypothetical protein HanLR1_Chr04g0147721 [Helianthus annuus]KAJ0761867.1 hypothetical protein HanOQP8_Chr04g0154931 [Helianthus annuus]
MIFDLDFFHVLICESFDIITLIINHWIPNSYHYNNVNTPGFVVFQHRSSKVI